MMYAPQGMYPPGSYMQVMPQQQQVSGSGSCMAVEVNRSLQTCYEVGYCFL